MRVFSGNRQNGYVLLLTLILLMGIGGVVVAGFTQDAKRQVDHEKFLHNKRVLEEAKRALLQFAYNYPVTNQRGPGRLPCADTDNDGTPNTAFGTCIQLGRLPWNQPNLNLYDIRDADGRRLWYAVSSNFATNVAGGNIINSDAIGTITLRDQVGNFIYDASGGGEGVAAVIIAPGAATARNGVPQDRSIANGDNPFDTNPDTDAGIINAANYLDRFFGIEDNAVFAQNSTNGFILGRVDDLAVASILVNDQIAVITTREIVEVAQSAALQAYQDAINRYRNNIGVDAYPWLDDYATQVTVLDDYDGDVGTRLGRVPSLFTDYFVGPLVADSETIRSELIMDLKIDENNDTVYDFEMTETVPASVAPDVFFRGVNGNLSASFNSGYSFTRFFWDGHDFNLPSAPADGIWVLCPVVTGTEEDCNQNGAGNYIGGATSVDWMKVRRVTVTFDNLLSPFEFPFSDKMATPLVYAPPTAANHATVTAEYNNSSAYLNMVWSQDNDFQSGFTEFPPGNNGNFSIDIGWDNFTLGMTYYPVLPDWALATEDDWHDSIQMAYADAYEPGNAAVNCTPGFDCITVTNSGGVTNDKAAVLTLAAEHNFVDEAADGFDNDLVDIFDLGNDDSNDIFVVRAGNDVILVMR